MLPTMELARRRALFSFNPTLVTEWLLNECKFTRGENLSIGFRLIAQIFLPVSTRGFKGVLKHIDILIEKIGTFILPT